MNTVSWGRIPPPAKAAELETFEEFHIKVSIKIARLRIEKGLTQEQLSEAADMGPRAAGHVEIRKSVPSIETIYRLAKGLGVTPAELLT